MNEEHVHDYLKRTGDAAIGGDFRIEDEKGFITYSFSGPVLTIFNLYGDAAHFLTIINEVAKKNRKTKTVGATKRMFRAKAFERKYGYKIVGYILEKRVK